MLKALALKICRRETPFYDKLYRFAKGARGFEIPLVWPVYHLLSIERNRKEYQKVTLK